MLKITSVGEVKGLSASDVHLSRKGGTLISYVGGAAQSEDIMKRP